MLLSSPLRPAVGQQQPEHPPSVSHTNSTISATSSSSDSSSGGSNIHHSAHPQHAHISPTLHRQHYHSHQHHHTPISTTTTGPPPSSSSSTSSSASSVSSSQNFGHYGHSHRRSNYYQQQDESAITVEEYEELLNAEVWVEVPKLREYARHGISREVRGEVWLYLLEVQEAGRSKEVSTQKQRRQEFEQLDKEPNESSKRVRGEISRYLRKTQIASSRDLPLLFEEVISAYCNQNHQVEYYPAMVNLCAPFVYSIKREWDAYLCFEKMINMLDDHFNGESINEAVAKFMTLFHTCLPDLYSYFEEEEVDIKEWAASALQFVLSRELPLENTMRLWDTYFAIPNAGWIELHPYACLAILKHLKEGFEDLEQSEIRTMLMRLPHLDLDRIINEAFNLRHEILERQISDAFESIEETVAA
ncbi:hypothetical protein BGZ99_006280 [Dissophora globulifera]|uniref:Rab-GAP TBC domain-containing protein n=1 Tax=Dissophora globulifera TaxID=979702 RepID=A0A9P6RHI8_9FUNG|nr:hypothetical protein BGZ99_006280 [Dissophora globulifera]